MNYRVLLLVAAVAVPARAQDAGHGEPHHVCGTDASSPEARAALAAFRDAREAGLLLVAGKSASPPEIGTQRQFRVSESGWVPMQFELVDAEDGLYHLWVEAGELASGRVTADVIQELREALVERTPGSILDPDAGVMANNEALLGPPPNYDGDGVTDVLMYDIDPTSTGGSFVAGYVNSADINPNAGPGTGNQADILYLDSNQGIRNGTTAGAAAHEYAHLIHFATGFDTETFISEGIAEYMTIVNGLGRSRYSFAAIPGETTLPLMTWRGGNVRDYARAELFFRYVGEQFSPQSVAEIASNPYKSASGIDSVLASRGSSLARVTLDYHSANLVDDERFDDRFAYGPTVQTGGVNAAFSTQIAGDASSETAPFAQGEWPSLESGAVNYIALSNVSDLRFRYDVVVAPILTETARQLLGGRAFFLAETGERSWADLSAQGEEHFFPGHFLRVEVALANVKPGNTVVSRYDYQAAWSPFGQATALEDALGLPWRADLSQNYPNPFNPQTRIDFRLPAAGPVRLTVHDQLGREVAVLADNSYPAGSHSVTFDAGPLASGTYLYVLQAGGQRQTRLLTLLK